MINFFWNIVLALVWTAATEQLTVANLLVGLFLGYAVLWFSQPVLGASSYFRKVPQIVKLAVFFVWDLLKANLRVAYDVVTPTNYMRPGVVAIPLDAETDIEITLLATFITITPGTLSLEISEDRKLLYIHAMYIDDLEAFRRSVKEEIERRILEVLR